MPDGVTQCANCRRVLYTKDANPADGKCPECHEGRSTLPESCSMFGATVSNCCDTSHSHFGSLPPAAAATAPAAEATQSEQ